MAAVVLSGIAGSIGEAATLAAAMATTTDEPGKRVAVEHLASHSLRLLSLFRRAGILPRAQILFGVH